MGHAGRGSRRGRAAGHVHRPRRDPERVRHGAAAGDQLPRPRAGHRQRRCGRPGRLRGRGPRGRRGRGPRAIDLPPPGPLHRRGQGGDGRGRAAGPGGRMTAGNVVTTADVRFGADGLVPSVVQDAADGRVLMVAWMDAEALEATVATGEVHFHSRSRGRLWRKGETSGNVLRLVSIALDCDADALLVTAEPAGPTCHRGTRSCFDADGSPAAAPQTQGLGWLDDLWTTIASRAAERPAGSYTTSLLDGGVDAVGRKVTEEATEMLIAAKDDAVASTDATRAALAGEAADLLYHALVLLAERDLPPAEVMAALRTRHAD